MALLVGVEGAHRRVEHLNALGDRILEALPGGTGRWGFLDGLRPVLASPGEAGLSKAAPAIG